MVNDGRRSDRRAHPLRTILEEKIEDVMGRAKYDFNHEEESPRCRDKTARSSSRAYGSPPGGAATAPAGSGATRRGPAATTARSAGSRGAGQAGVESGTQGHVARRSRPRVHADLLTVAIRGHFAERMRALSERHGMSLAKLLKDALLVYEGQIDAGYEPVTSLRRWQERQADE